MARSWKPILFVQMDSTNSSVPQMFMHLARLLQKQLVSFTGELRRATCEYHLRPLTSTLMLIETRTGMPALRIKQDAVGPNYLYRQCRFDIPQEWTGYDPPKACNCYQQAVGVCCRVQGHAHPGIYSLPVRASQNGFHRL